MTFSWETVRQEFVFDGSLRDIYAHGTTLADWQRMLEWLERSPYEIVFRLNNLPAELPSSASEVFMTKESASHMMAVDFAGVRAVCHFFVEHEIEFDIDPREVNTQTQVDALFGFMRDFADAVGKDVVLTPENAPEMVIFRIRPGSPQVDGRTRRLSNSLPQS